MTYICGRLRAAGKTNAEGTKKTRTRERHARAMPAPEANAELQANIDVRKISLLLYYKNFVYYK